MLPIKVKLENPELDFIPTICPYCRYVENLDGSIDGNWECENCGEEYFVTHLRAIIPSGQMANIHTPDDIENHLTLFIS